ncbi:DUF202 domain-containing protein [Planctomonas sp. JC2975]|uniref:DUF202 domain-containing protein n=1 Tax=Planctomonas sp. JC2975 TaxID=2729626 RepID=UPI00147537CE|nr:DUF202 domain-containing protein [Planctomonas sp. JC2975]NNC11352.1 DUF202 domain-containing protein [Planctomonas sp. JC2975]
MSAAPLRDPGLQGERTALAWSRTCLALAVNGLLALRDGWQDDAGPLIVTGVILIAVAAAFVLYGNLRGRALAGNGRHHDRMPRATPTIPLALLALATLAACGVGIASTLIQR